MADPSAADRETARSLMDEGDKLLEERDLAGALKSYRAAHALMNVPTTGLEVGKTEAALGQLLEARDTLLAVSRLPTMPREPVAFAKARVEATELAEALAERIPSLLVVLKGPHPSDEPLLEIDGVGIPREAHGLPRKLNPGPHKIAASAQGFEPSSIEVTLAESEQREVRIQLVPTAQEPFEEPSAPPPAPAAPRPQRSAHSTARKVLIYGGAGLAAVGVAAGAVTGALSLSKVSKLKDECPDRVCTPGSQSELDSARSLAQVSNISFATGVVGAVVALVGVVAFDTPRSAPEKSASMHLTPIIGDMQLGLSGVF